MSVSLAEKFHILAESAKYDASCASSGSNVTRHGKLGSTARAGCCHSWSADGRCISLLKILQSNHCMYDCGYCVNRCSNDIPRATLTPQELAQITVDFYTRNYIEGLFLSSGVIRSPDHTMEMMLATMRILRRTHAFAGYIHCKIIPGASTHLVDAAGGLADRLSVNIELPTRKSLALLAPQKTQDGILVPMRRISENVKVRALARKNHNARRIFAPAGQSTQMIIGATPDSDLQIMRLSAWLYAAMGLKRVYYSAYIPVRNDAHLPALPAAPFLREHRLYQADWLIRMYGFGIDEILDEYHPLLDEAVDPKVSWALRHLERFPVEINTADVETLVRVPGIGVRSAQKIIQVRKVKTVHVEDLPLLRISMKRAQYFITVNGEYRGDAPLDARAIFTRLTLPPAPAAAERQKTFFEQPGFTAAYASALSGEL